MKNTGLLISTDIKNNFSSKSIAAIWYSIAVLLVVAVVVLFCVLLIGPEMEKSVPDRTKLDIYLSVILYSASIIGLGVNLNSLGVTSMMREKSRGNIQSLLVTTLNLREIWIGKSLAIFIPGLIIGELITLVTLIIINYIYFVPTIGFLFNPWVAVTSFIVFPLIYLFQGLLVCLVGLTGKPVNANIIGQIFLPVYVNIVIQLPLRTDFMDYTSWHFVLVNTAVVIIIAIIIMILQHRATKEKVALSY